MAARSSAVAPSAPWSISSISGRNFGIVELRPARGREQVVATDQRDYLHTAGIQIASIGHIGSIAAPFG